MCLYPFLSMNVNMKRVLSKSDRTLWYLNLDLNGSILWVYLWMMAIANGEHYGKDMTLLSAFRAMEWHDSCKTQCRQTQRRARLRRPSQSRGSGELKPLWATSFSSLASFTRAKLWWVKCWRCDVWRRGARRCRDFVWHYSIQTPHGCCTTGGALRV